MSYSVALIKTSASPGSGQATIANYPAFQLDSQSGLVVNPTRLFTQLLTGTVKFVPGTCDIRAGDDRKVVVLPAVANVSLSTVGATSGRTALSVAVQNCVGVKQVKFSFSGAPDDNMPVAFRNTGTAKGVAVRLAKAGDDGTIAANGTASSIVEPVTNDAASVRLHAEYIGTTGRPTAGSVSSLATMNIDYQ
ncbi:hypothetical protein BDSB_16660 [Burkholderia dolosa PC543]|nr:hypothetical protein BDSB_16660 [Burkholderia dolosa PC543]